MIFCWVLYFKIEIVFSIYVSNGMLVSINTSKVFANFSSTSFSFQISLTWWFRIKYMWLLILLLWFICYLKIKIKIYCIVRFIPMAYLWQWVNNNYYLVEPNTLHIYCSSSWKRFIYYLEKKLSIDIKEMSKLHIILRER